MIWARMVKPALKRLSEHDDAIVERLSPFAQWIDDAQPRHSY